MIEDDRQLTPEEILKQTNKDLFRRFSEQHGRFVWPEDPEHWLDARLIKDPDGAIEDWYMEIMPDGFSFPIIVVYETHQNARQQVEVSTSRYGRLPRIVVGADGEVYDILNAYYFDEKGNSTKIEDISRASSSSPRDSTLEQKLDDIGGQNFSIDVIQRIDVTPEEGNRFVQFSVGDYEKLLSLLYLIEEGELLPYVPFDET